VILVLWACGSDRPAPAGARAAPDTLADGALAVVEAGPDVELDEVVMVPDTDGDRLPDLAVEASPMLGSYRLMLVSGARLDGRVALADVGTPRLDTDTTVPIGFVASGGDPNADGLTELWVGDRDGAVLLWGGIGRPDDPVVAPVLVGEPLDAQSGDADGDGGDDLVVATWAAIHVLREPSFATPIELARADATFLHERCMHLRTESADLDGDGVPELVMGTRDCREAPTVVAASAPFEGVSRLGDHRDPWLFVGESGSTESTRQSVAGDTDGDGHLDLLVVGPDAAGAVRGPLVGERDLEVAELSLFGGWVDGAPAGDLDGDGADDVALLTVAGLEVFRGGRAGFLSSLDADARWPHERADALARGEDLDQDGLAELILTGPLDLADETEGVVVLSPAGLL
jgi:hypothetical protein